MREGRRIQEDFAVTNSDEDVNNNIEYDDYDKILQSSPRTFSEFSEELGRAKFKEFDFDGILLNRKTLKKKEKEDYLKIFRKKLISTLPECLNIISRIIPNPSNVYVYRIGNYLIFRSSDNNRLVLTFELLTESYLKFVDPSCERIEFTNDENLENITPLPTNEDFERQDEEEGKYTRGHAAVAANHKFTKDSYKDTFLYSNVWPEVENLKSLENIEEESRKLAQKADYTNVLRVAVYEDEPKKLNNSVDIPSYILIIVRQVKNNKWYFAKIKNEVNNNSQAQLQNIGSLEKLIELLEDPLS